MNLSTFAQCFLLLEMPGLHLLAKIPSPSSLRLRFPAAPVMLQSYEAGCAKPFSCHHPLPAFWRACPAPGTLEEAELSCEQRPGLAELSKHWSVGGSPAEQLWPCFGRQEVGQCGTPLSGVQRDALSHRQGSVNCMCNSQPLSGCGWC